MPSFRTKPSIASASASGVSSVDGHRSAGTRNSVKLSPPASNDSTAEPFAAQFELATSIPSTLTIETTEPYSTRDAESTIAAKIQAARAGGQDRCRHPS